MEEKFNIRCYFQVSIIKGNYYSFKLFITGKDNKRLYKYIGRVFIRCNENYRVEILEKVNKAINKIADNFNKNHINKIYIFTSDKKYIENKQCLTVDEYEIEIVYLGYCDKILDYKRGKKKKITSKKPELVKMINKENFNIVFIDMEINFIKREKGNYESVAIGAVLCDKYGEVKKTFYSLIKPNTLNNLNEFCIDIAKINYNSLKSAPEFKEVINKFYLWCGKEKVIFASWGINDIKVIKRDCLYKGISKEIYDDIRHNYINFQEEFMKNTIKNKENISLLNALRYYNLGFMGRQHNPQDDAYNLSRVYKSYIRNYRG